jgi:hypothetical protein
MWRLEAGSQSESRCPSGTRYRVRDRRREEVARTGRVDPRGIESYGVSYHETQLGQSCQEYTVTDWLGSDGDSSRTHRERILEMTAYINTENN